MSKTALKKYLISLPEEEAKEQLLDLYQRFPAVKQYYDFIFNPKEEKLVQEVKTKISNEFFPVKRKRPKARRSIAQKAIKHFITLGVSAHLIADVMLYTIEIGQTFSCDRTVPDSFFKSMHNSFAEAVPYIVQNGMLSMFQSRIVAIYTAAQEQHWPNMSAFDKTIDLLENE